MNKESSLLYIIKYVQGELEYYLINGDGTKKYKTDLKSLDVGFLPWYRSISSEHNIKKIFVNADSLGGFVASRLILITLNLIAWHYNVPIVNANLKNADDSENKTMLQNALHTNGEFTVQVLPAYQKEPDISKSKKISKFTIK